MNEKLELLEQGAAEGKTLNRVAWAKQLLRSALASNTRLTPHEKLLRLPISILEALACLQGCKLAVFNYGMQPGWVVILRNAAFAALGELDAAAARALVARRPHS